MDGGYQYRALVVMNDFKSKHPDLRDTEFPLVYIVVVNWNGWPDTVQCLASLEQLNYPRAEIVLIDNGSSDDSVERIKLDYPQVNMLELKNNLGFTGGHNIGLKYALDHAADYVLLLNNDTVVEPSFLDLLVASALETPDAAAVTPKIYFLEPRDKPIIWSAGGRINLWLARSGNRGRGKRDEGQFDQTEDTDFASGCCILMSRSALEAVGLLDNAYFAYFEDADWCLRARRSGYRIRYIPQATIWHAVGSSSNKESGEQGPQSPVVHYLAARNQLWFTRSYTLPLQRFVAYPAYFVRRILFYSAVFTILRRWQKLRYLWRGFRDGLGRKPRLPA